MQCLNEVLACCERYRGIVLHDVDVRESYGETRGRPGSPNRLSDNCGCMMDSAESEMWGRAYENDEI